MAKDSEDPGDQIRVDPVPPAEVVPLLPFDWFMDEIRFHVGGTYAGSPVEFDTAAEKQEFIAEIMEPYVRFQHLLPIGVFDMVKELVDNLPVFSAEEYLEHEENTVA